MAKADNNLLSIEDVSRAEIERLIDRADKLRGERVAKRLLPSFILGLLFFQESTRTRIGFQTAAYRLGGEVFLLKETKFQNSMSSAESTEDTVRVLQSYADIICIRHSDENIFLRIAGCSKRPIINCGNGFDEHPSQTLTDLMAIKKFCGMIDNLSIAIVGDLRHMRAAHSLLLGLLKFSGISVRCISPKILSMPEKYKVRFAKSKNSLVETENFDLSSVDVVYMTGFAPKTPLKVFNKSAREKYQLNSKKLYQLKDKAIILCPLPRVDEISPEVDNTKFAKYFEQSDLGLYMRMAIIMKLLGR